MNNKAVNTQANSIKQWAEDYQQNGYIAGYPVLDAGQARQHRRALEQAEAQAGPMHYKPKVHTLFRSPYQLATHPALLDMVEALIGPDILLHNVTYIIKEANSTSHVSWHQDLTYWGFDGEEQVSAWLALSPATAESGCMITLPGTHRQGQREHYATDDANNVLLSGQTVADVDEQGKQWAALAPGEASLHHGWLLHCSSPNTSNDRRIGLNIQYIATHMKQTKSKTDTALLVRGVDKYGHFEPDVPATTDLDPAAVEHHARLQAHYESVAGNAN